ncbi:MAG: hypothetical protein ABSG80_16620 [Verrucomicrobiota bacterium]|jgi:hypothetical protein
MAWIKRNLLFVIGGILALGLLGAAGFYNYKGWSHNAAAFDKLNGIYSTLRDLIGKKPSPGNDKVDNIKAAKEQEGQVREWVRQAADCFQPIAPIPNTGTNAVSSEAFAAALRRTIDQLQHEAEIASVTLPPKYNFSFEAQRSLVKFDTRSLGALAAQFGEVRAIVEILFAAKVNSLDGIQRVRVSDDDANGPQADYFDDHSVTNSLAVLTPYQITFRSFSPEIAQVLAGLASSPHGFIVKSINVQPAGAAAAMSPEGGPTPFPPPSPAAGPTVTPGRGGLQTVLNEQLLRVTLVVEVVKLLPKK